MTPDDLVTAADAEDTETAAADPGMVVAAEARTISGIVLPWHKQGNTSAGGLRFTPKAIRIPKDPSRVKLLRDHSTQGGVPVGVMTAWENRPEGLHATFSIASTPDGDRALVEAAEHVRDSFSIEAKGLARTGPDVTTSTLKAVALVPFPAFEDAQIDSVSASEHDEDEDETDENTAPAGDEHTTDTPDTTDSEDIDMPGKLRSAIIPSGIPGAPKKLDPVTATEVIETMLAVRHGISVDEAHAALVDITNSAHLDATPPAWLGELWAGVTYQRRIIPQLTQAALTSWKAVGYRWVTKPKVAKYAGDKADIPSFPTEIEPVEVSAQRWAGGNDLDRKFLDFNDAAFIAAYWAAMAESYAYETDKEAGAFLVANATAIATPAADLLRAVATAAITIDQAINSPATFALINPADLVSVLDIAQLDAPAYGNIAPLSDPSSWITSEFVTAGTVIVGAKPAVTHYELGGSPIRAQAAHIAKGGEDAALFGYTALLLNKAPGLAKIGFGTP